MRPRIDGPKTQRARGSVTLGALVLVVVVACVENREPEVPIAPLGNACSSQKECQKGMCVMDPCVISPCTAGHCKE